MNDTNPPPEVFFLPLAIPDREDLAQRLAADPTGLGPRALGILARRIPDFLHQLINHGDEGPTAMLEVQSPGEEGPVRWVDLEDVPDAEEAFDLLPAEEQEEVPRARAVVVGEIAVANEGVLVTLSCYFEAGVETDAVTLRALLPFADPVPALRRLSERLARVLEIRILPPPARLLTKSGRAFFQFLAGLDGAALLSGELAVEAKDDPEELLRPFAEALRLDPSFGLALRTAHLALADALEGERVGESTCTAVLDRCLASSPSDGEACVAVAEHFVGLGDDQRAITWLEHAVQLEPPPARSLETLGILYANRGATIQARDLWLKGLETDGHPDFFAHLARLAFTDGDLAEAWDKVLRGLRRTYERAVRAAEWEADGRGVGVILRYLVEHLDEHDAPDEVAEALADLAGVLAWDDDRIDLGLCLLAVGEEDLAREELEAGLGGTPDAEVRDRGLRALLGLQVEDFEARFRRAVDEVVGAKDVRHGLAEFEVFLAHQPEFWPAVFFQGVALSRLARDEESLDRMAEVLRLSPGQPDALHQMAVLFDKRGNPKRAVECVDEALLARSDDVQLLTSRALFLGHLGRLDAARETLDDALKIAPKDPELRRLRKQL